MSLKGVSFVLKHSHLVLLSETVSNTKSPLLPLPDKTTAGAEAYPSVHPWSDHAERQTSLHTHIHIYGWFRITNQPNMHVFDLWEEVRAPRETPHRDRENIQTPHSETQDLHLWAALLYIMVIYQINKVNKWQPQLWTPSARRSAYFTCRVTVPHWLPTHRSLRNWLSLWPWGSVAEKSNNLEPVLHSSTRKRVYKALYTTCLIHPVRHKHSPPLLYLSVF